MSELNTDIRLARFKDSMFLWLILQDSLSISTRETDSAPNRAAPIPSIPFPEPMSATLQPCEISLKARISKSHLAAISPSV